MIAERGLPSSFRDPSGFLFARDGLIYRQVNFIYKENYEHLLNSGLCKSLIEKNLLVPHDEIQAHGSLPENAYRIIKPELIPFISYPYEWSFSQLKDAALTTLQIQKEALNYGMSLKDCSAYNIQFRKGKPILIDTLSFEKYKEGEPWVAYRQFCQHFLAPLALMAKTDIRLNQLLRIYIDGIPLDLASRLLPKKTKFSFSLLTHIHLHARTQKMYSDRQVKLSSRRLSKNSFLGIIMSLESAVKKLKWEPEGTEWGDYYEDTNYTAEALNHKKQIVSEFIEKIHPLNVWDFGANDGFFSRICSDRGINTLSFDIDPAAVEKNYIKCSLNGEEHILPLLLDLTNPSPNIGWENRERMSLRKRKPADAALALALIHHLAISNNLPFARIAHFFYKICNTLVIEFVPKDDSQVQRLLSTREDIFPDYNRETFESEFGKYFRIHASLKIRGSERVLYLMQKISN